MDSEPSGGRLGPWRPRLARGTLALAGLGTLVFILDQVTKAALSDWLPYGSSRPVIDGFFHLVHVRNTGMAFSLFADSDPWIRSWLMPLVQGAVIVGLLLLMRTLDASARLSRLALALVLGGAAGNLWDRLNHGYVTDFLDFFIKTYHWPAFNVADSAITVGAALLLIDSMAVSRRSRVAAAGR